MQYRQRPNRQQQHFAKAWLDAGALMVLGSHPHVMQPIHFYQTKDGRQTLIAYSLGNFVSNQGSLANRSSGILAITLNKQDQGLRLEKLTFYPSYMQNRGGKVYLEWLNKKRHPGYRLLRRILGDKIPLKLKPTP